MTDNEAILKRHSVRNYLDKKIDADTVRLLQEAIDDINQKGHLHLQFIEDAGGTFNRLLNKAMGLGSAPSVIACVGPIDETLSERVGYYGEQLVLLAQKLGLNTCWAGTFNRKNVKAVIDDGEELVIVIAIGYGKNQGHEGRKTKTVEQVTVCDTAMPDWFKAGAEAALMAPTAINQQRFEIAYTDGQAVITDKGGVLSQIDLGIVKYHFEVGSKH